MSPDPTSLERLHDLLLPAPAPWWPPAPGWLWLLGGLAVAALVLVIVAVARWQRNRYRREALAELARLEAAAGEAPQDALIALSALLKRTALTAYPRAQVAALSGPGWFAFLDRTGGTRFAGGLGATLEQGLYRARSQTLDPRALHALSGEVGAWIRRHRPPSAQDQLEDGAAAATARDRRGGG